MPGVQEDEHIELEHILSDSRKACKKAFAQTRKFILPCKKRLFPAGRRFSFAKRGGQKAMQQVMRTKKAEALQNGKRIDWEQKKKREGTAGEITVYPFIT